METPTGTSVVAEGNVTPSKTRRVKCAVCPVEFEAVSRFAKTCSNRCRQKKWRGQVITTDADALEEVFGEKYPNAAERLQVYYQTR